MRLKELRKACGWTQAAFAARVGFSREYVARLETGKHDPSVSTVEKLAKALNVKVGELLE